MNNLCVFADFFSTIPRSATLQSIADTIRSNEQLKSITLAYRSTRAHSIKERSYTFAVAVTFDGGKGQEHIRAFTGLSLVDFDHVPAEKLAEAKSRICQDTHTLLCYVTASGEGLRVIFGYEMPPSTDLEMLKKHYVLPFLAGNSYYGRLTGLPWDEKCKNATRLSALAHDPDVYYCPGAVPFTLQEVNESSKQTQRQMKEQKARQRIQTYYEDTIRPMLAAKGIAYEPGNHNNYVMRVGYLLAEKRYARQTAISWALATFPDYDGTEQVMRSCFDNVRKYGSTAGREGSGQKVTTVEEIEAYLTQHAKLRYNEVLACVEEYKDGQWRQLDKREFNDYWREISRITRTNAADVERVLCSGFVKPFNPFKSYLEEVAADPDDGTDYLRLLADTVRVKGSEKEQQFWRECLKKWMVGLVAGWLEDEEANTAVLVFIGQQGTNKSTWQRMLMPPELRKYFSIMLNTGRMNKDDKIKLVTKGLVCCEELDTLSPSELNQFKSIVTLTHIDERPPYGHFSERRKRHASFCGNGNNKLFLSDLTGNRRWMPFEIVKIESPREHPFPYRGIFAQAYRLYRSGFRYWLNDEENRRLNEYNKAFESPKPEMELVSLFFRKPGPGETGQFITTTRALQVIGGNLSQKLSLNKISQAFTDLGFERKRYQGLRGFICVERSSEEIRRLATTISFSRRDEDSEDQA